MTDDIARALDNEAHVLENNSAFEPARTIHLLREAATLLRSLAQQVEEMRKRLEIPEAPFEAYDGIVCRDETIKLLDDQIERLKARALAAEAKLASVREVLEEVNTSVVDGKDIFPDTASQLDAIGQVAREALSLLGEE